MYHLKYYSNQHLAGTNIPLGVANHRQRVTARQKAKARLEAIKKNETGIRHISLTWIEPLQK